MEVSSMIIIGVLVVLLIGGAVGLYFYKKRNLVTLFNQVYVMSQQVPGKNKNSFLLLMFKESMSASKSKGKLKELIKNKGKAQDNGLNSKLNNPKYLQVQMIKMASILKDPSKVNDKTMKKSLLVLKDYQAWEKAKHAKAKELSQTKVS